MSASDNDWSLVRVFNLKTGGWGGKIYPVQGFIGGTPDARPEQDRPDTAAGLTAEMVAMPRAPPS